MNINRKISGFTMVEMLVVIGVIGVLAAVVLVSTGSYRDSARASSVNTQLNSAVSAMASCWAFGGKVLQPTGNGGEICQTSSSYGNWPDVDSMNFTYDPGNYVDCTSLGYIQDNEAVARSANLFDFFVSPVYAVVTQECIDQNSDWYFSAKSNDTDQVVCCNKKMNGCKIINSTCDASIK
jgi:prepilin-type N-terminal cleavage/methylation domain-containing protein